MIIGQTQMATMDVMEMMGISILVESNMYIYQKD